MGRRKDVLLLVLAVLALGVAFYTFRSKPASPGAAVPATPAPSKPQRKDQAKGADQGAGLPSASLPGGGTRNPFEGPAAGAAGSTKPAPVAPEKPTTAQTPASPAPQNPFPVAAKPPTPAAGGAKTSPAGATLSLNGIVAGKQAMAVIREGDRRYYVKVGDRIGDRYRVQTISQKEVVLIGSEGKVILRMGGRQ